MDSAPSQPVANEAFSRRDYDEIRRILRDHAQRCQDYNCPDKAAYTRGLLRRFEASHGIDLRCLASEA